MRCVISLVLSTALVFNGCLRPQDALALDINQTEELVQVSTKAPFMSDEGALTEVEISEYGFVSGEGAMFTDLDDQNLLSFIENTVRKEIHDILNGDQYCIGVKATCCSAEYCENLAYNSRPNEYFGYTLDELEEQFQGVNFVFTLGDDGQTIAKEFEAVEGLIINEVVKNVAIGGGVILVIATVSALTGGVAPAVSMVLAVSAKTALITAGSSAVLGGGIEACVQYALTGDIDEALEAALFAASEEFKVCAIIGAPLGGIAELSSLRALTKGGLTLNKAAAIRKESCWSSDTIKEIHSFEEYGIYKNADLTPAKLSNGKSILKREIDWGYMDELGRTNAERVRDLELAPLDEVGNVIELHHIGQKADGSIAMLTAKEHRASGNSRILHYAKEGKDISSTDWQKQKRDIWKTVLKDDLGV